MPSSPAQADPTTVNVIRVAALLTTVALAMSATGLFEKYLDAQRGLSLPSGEVGVAEVEAGAGEAAAAAADALDERPVPGWLAGLHAACAGVALLGLFVSVPGGRWPFGLVLTLVLVCVPGAVAWTGWSLWQDFDSLSVSKVGEKPAPWTYFIQLFLTNSLILSPPVLLFLYQRASILDRYLARGLALPATMCFTGFLAIWIVIDLTDNGPTFFSVEGGAAQLGSYYLVQLPQMVMLVLPVTLLLSLLYTLGRMSRSNEIISMLGAGRSLFEVARPLLAIGLYCTLACLVLNYHWAPKAEARRQEILEELHALKGKDPATRSNRERYAAKGWMYRNSMDQRTWAVGGVPADLVKGEMRYVCVWCQDGEGRIFRTYKSSSAKWNYLTREWTLTKCKVYDYDRFGTARMTFYPVLTHAEWNETPWHVLSSSYNEDYLGVPELTTYLQTNEALPRPKLSPYRTTWHLSWAEPFRCLFIVLMATPLGIVHSRRGVLGGVAAAIGILFSLIFLDGFFLQLGKTNVIPSWLGAWGPNLLLLAVGATLFHIRSENRELPKLKLPQVFSRA